MILTLMEAKHYSNWAGVLVRKLYLFTAMFNRMGSNKIDIAVSLRYSFKQQMCLAKDTI